MSTMQPLVLIRPATLFDVPKMASLAASVYWATPFTSVLHPHRHQFPNDYARGHFQNTLSRFLNPRGRSFVACLAGPGPESENGEIVGFMQCARSSADKSNKPEISGSRTAAVAKFEFVCWILLGWLYGVWVTLEKYFRPDRSVNEEVMKVVFGDGDAARKVHFGAFPEKWYVFMLAVEEKWQGMGIGRSLMGKVIEMAKREKIPITLSSSPEGERLYRKLGFELMARFETDVAGDAADAGGWFTLRAS